MWLFLVFITVVLAFWGYVCVINTWAAAQATERGKKLTSVNSEPFISVLIPIATIREDHLELLEVLAKQEYSNYEVIVIYERWALSRICNLPRLLLIQNDCVFAPEHRSNKVSNLTYGLKHISRDSEIVVFLDDDIALDKWFLEEFRYYLERYPGSVVTSYRHFTTATSIREHILLVANNIVAAFMFLPRWHCVWGGCFGLRRQLADDVKLEGIWSSSISEDLDLTAHLRELRIPLRITPEPLCTSVHFTRSYTELFEWGVRQFRLARFYATHNYIDALIISATFTVASLLTLTLMGAGGTWLLISALTQLLTICGTYLFFRHRGVQISLIKCALILPFIPPMTLAVAVIALFGGSITWKGHRYSLKKHHGVISPWKSFVR